MMVVLTKRRSYGQRRQINPAPLAITLIAGFGELDTLGAFEKRRRERRVFCDMLEKEFPARAVAAAEWLDVRHLLPLLVKVHGLRSPRVEERFGRRHQRLHKAAMETADGGAQGSVHLDL